MDQKPVKKYWYKKWWWIVIILLLFLIIVNYLFSERKISIKTEFTEERIASLENVSTSNIPLVNTICMVECLTEKNAEYYLDLNRTYYNSEGYLVCGCKTMKKV